MSLATAQGGTIKWQKDIEETKRKKNVYTYN
jgi:hypothetical protein